jgi:hypothetical protein
MAALRGVRQEPAPAVFERLRKRWSADVVAAAVEVQWARTRAADKFGSDAERLWADREAVQMASSLEAAAWKARRFAGAASVQDLCCGMGGDLMELARVAPATGVELQPARAWMAQQNAGVTVECRDAVATPVAAELVHADPGRRSGGKRLLNTDDLLPPLRDVRAACARASGVGIKLGPGMDLQAHELHQDDELEFLCEHGTLTQQLVWSGALVRHAGQRTATRVDRGLTISGTEQPTPCSGDGQWRDMMAVPCPALERARLVHVVAGAACEPAVGLGILTADAIAESPWLERHRILAHMPARERPVREWLQAHGGGTPIVRTRGKACDPNEWELALRTPGDAAHTVWVLRTGHSRVALVTEPVLSST